MCCCFNDCTGELLRVIRLENTRANEHTIGSQMHHQSSISRSRHTACSEVNDRQFAQFVDFKQQFVWNAQSFGFIIQLVQ
ncbi:hypothetical protein D3C75_985080 [compost metagenome]